MALVRGWVSRLATQSRQAWENAIQNVPRLTASKQTPTRVADLSRHTSWLKRFTGTPSERLSLAAKMRNRYGPGKLGQFSRTGRSFPLLAFVAFNMGPGSEDMSAWERQRCFENVCDDIKNIFATKTSEPVDGVGLNSLAERVSSLSQVELGNLIGKGCNAAVYEGRIKTDVDNDSDITILSDLNEAAEGDDEDCDFEFVYHHDCSEIVMSEEPSDGCHGDRVIYDCDNESDISIVTFDAYDSVETRSEVSKDPAAVDVGQLDLDSMRLDMSYDLAVKMMFNYHAASNSSTILQEMKQELAPAAENLEIRGSGNQPKKKGRLKSHPNIVKIHGCFVDDFPDLADGPQEYPAALPIRLNPDGIGRNKTLFILMEKYDCTLRDYLSLHNPSSHERCLIFAQLLEAIALLEESNIAHRDIKSDNILVDLDSSDGSARVALSDFGHCLNEDRLCIPFETESVCRGGNMALMAPEIICAKSGLGEYLDYRKADLWSLATLAYEIFGGQNPFLRDRNGKQELCNATFQDADLPQMPDGTPGMIASLVHRMLQRDPARRPTPKQALNQMHCYLWLPRSIYSEPHPDREIMMWLQVMTTETLFMKSNQAHQHSSPGHAHQHSNTGHAHQHSNPRNVELALRKQFLASLDFDTIKECIRDINLD